MIRHAVPLSVFATAPIAPHRPRVNSPAASIPSDRGARCSRDRGRVQFFARANVAECFEIFLLSVIGDNLRRLPAHNLADSALLRHSIGRAAMRQARIIQAPSANGDNASVPDASSIFGVGFALGKRKLPERETRVQAPMACANSGHVRLQIIAATVVNRCAPPLSAIGDSPHFDDRKKISNTAP